VEESAAARVLNVACDEGDAEIAVGALPAVGLWVLVGKKALAENTVQEPNVGTLNRSFGAVIKLDFCPSVQQRIARRC
jgi:hypothetical protein